MPRFLRSFVLAAALVLAALGGFVAFTLPPRAVTLRDTPPPAIAYGAYHIHSDRSDGSGSPDDIAAAAARAGLQFVILTDHGDATRVPDPPTYRHGVLCLDAVEVNTLAGHIVVLGLDRPAPYPLAGEARDVIEDIHRLGGFAILAHPDSPNPNLRWRNWNVPYDGVEWINADSEWRDNKGSTLVSAALRSVVRPAEAVASLFSRPSRTLQRWDASTAGRPVVALAGVDAHARLDWRREDEPGGRTLIAWPRYVDMFRTLVQAVVLDQPLGGDGAVDGARVVQAIERGRTYSFVRAFAGPAVLDFHAEQAAGPTPMGSRLPDMSAMRLVADLHDVPTADVLLIRDGAVLARGKGRVEFFGPPSPGAYRAEVYFPGFSTPWVVANPIYANGPRETDVAPPPAVPPGLVSIGLADGWRVEKDAATVATIDASAQALALSYALGGGVAAGQYAAVATDVSSPDAFDGVTIVARADRPTRLSVQVRLLSGQRWRRSVYLDATAKPQVVTLQDFEPAETASLLRPTAARIRSVLVVVDTLNSAPGARGVVTISAISLNKAPTVPGGGPAMFER